MVVLSNSNPSYLFVVFSFAPVTIEVTSFPSYVSQIFFGSNWTLDLEVWGSSFTHHIVSLDKEFHSTLSFFSQVYKWVMVTYCWGGGGGNPAMD